MPHHRIICGDVIPALKALPDGYVDMLMTSVPYYALRDYGEDTATIWGGDKDCEHEWDSIPFGGRNKRTGDDDPKFANNLKNPRGNSDFCSKCMAWHGQLGLEPTPDLYIEHLRMVFAEVKRVLKKTGTCWVNIGDSYASGKSRYNSSPHTLSSKGRDEPMSWNKPDLYKEGYQDTCLCLIPELFLMMMVFDLGFILRNKNVWKKDNPMPSSVKNRFNNVWEPVYFFTKNNKPVYFYNDKSGAMVDKKPTSQMEGVDWDWKEVGGDYSDSETKISLKDAEKFGSPRARVYRKKKRKKISHWHSVDYWFDLDAVRAPYTEPLNRWGGNEVKIPEKTKWKSDDEKAKWCMSVGDRQSRPNPSGKNPGDFWNINTEPYPDAHFATFPTKLVEKPLLAGCPAEVCSVCGKARVRIVNKDYSEGIYRELPPDAKPRNIGQQQDRGRRIYRQGTSKLSPKVETIGWTDCECGKNPNSCFFCGYGEEHGNLKIKDGIYICDECLLQGKGIEDKYEPGIIIDPFSGSGTVGVVAEKLGRSSILIDIKRDYCEMAVKRLKSLVGQTDISGNQSTIKKEGF